MTRLDEIVRRLAEVSDQLAALEGTDHAARLRLESEQMALRLEAVEFQRGKDDRRSTGGLLAELEARRRQLDRLRDETQQGGCTGTTWVRSDPSMEGTLNHVMMKAQGAGNIADRIAEIEYELARREESVLSD